MGNLEGKVHLSSSTGYMRNVLHTGLAGGERNQLFHILSCGEMSYISDNEKLLL
jgi:hypothetical protein